MTDLHNSPLYRKYHVTVWVYKSWEIGFKVLLKELDLFKMFRDVSTVYHGEEGEGERRHFYIIFHLLNLSSLNRVSRSPMLEF